MTTVDIIVCALFVLALPIILLAWVDRVSDIITTVKGWFSRKPATPPIKVMTHPLIPADVRFKVLHMGKYPVDRSDKTSFVKLNADVTNTGEDHIRVRFSEGDSTDYYEIDLIAEQRMPWHKADKKF